MSLYIPFLYHTYAMARIMSGGSRHALSRNTMVITSGMLHHDEESNVAVPGLAVVILISETSTAPLIVIRGQPFDLEGGSMVLYSCHDNHH